MMRGLVCLGRVVDADVRAFLRVLRALVLSALGVLRSWLGDGERCYLNQSPKLRRMGRTGSTSCCCWRRKGPLPARWFERAGKVVEHYCVDLAHFAKGVAMYSYEATIT
jgi:hypothetical protein